MQDIEKNMDDLFRKAVDNYQLKPGESNWDKILPQLSSNTITPPASKKTNNVKKYFMLLLLFSFLFTAGLFTKYIVYKDAATDLHKPSKSEINNSDKELDNINKETNSAYKKQSEEKQSTSKKDYSLKQFQRQISNNSLFIKKINSNDALTDVMNEINIRPKAAPIFEDRTSKKSSELTNQNNLETTTQNKSSIEEKANASDSLNNIAIKLNPAQKQHGIYFGAATGASFNSVKYQRFRKPGFDIGVIAGYQINNKVSVETGLFFSKKYYYTNGKYFSMDKVGSSMPPEMKILSLKGSSTVFEAPLKFKYNIFNKKKTVVSASAGISSYLLTNEKNNYLTSMNGTRENIISSYENSSRYFAAALDFSLSYEYKFRNNKNIRIEPYIQIPLKGIGMGTLPVMGAGLHFGFTVFPRR